jgi:hypothetical protein
MTAKGPPAMASPPAALRQARPSFLRGTPHRARPRRLRRGRPRRRSWPRRWSRPRTGPPSRAAPADVARGDAQGAEPRGSRPNATFNETERSRDDSTAEQRQRKEPARPAPWWSPVAIVAEGPASIPFRTGPAAAPPRRPAPPASPIVSRNPFRASESRLRTVARPPAKRSRAPRRRSPPTKSSGHRNRRTRR